MNVYLKHKKALNGFSMVEISIVIIIVALLIAAVTTGQSIVHAVKLRSIITEGDMYKVAYRGFILQYNSIPGDMTNAFSYWGNIAGCTNNDVSKDITGCNGNGNSRINGPVVFIPRAESNLAWQFMALAGLIPGKYAGASSSIIGNGMPAARYDSSVGISFAYANNYSSFASASVVNSISIPSVKNNFLIFGKNAGPTAVGSATVGGFLTPTDASNIDIKIDDGFPTKGLFLSYTGRPQTSGPENPIIHFCTSANPFSSYILDHNVKTCAIMMTL